MSVKSKKIIFITPYPNNTAPSQRFRFEQYFEVLKNNNYNITLSSFLSESVWKILYKRGYTFKKIIGVITGFLRRIILIFSISKYDFVFIHREASPIGPPIFEWIISKILKKKIIYDFDDAIWMTQKGQNSKLMSFIKWHSKVAKICKWSYKITCGNQYLVDFASQFNENVILIPTTVDTDKVHNKIKIHSKEDQLVIGWTGTHSTLIFLENIVPILEKLSTEFDFTFLIISNKKPNFNIKNQIFIKWTEESEIEDLLKMDIGLMPTEDSEWGKGKCGFKAIQYMALGIPAIATNTAMNATIIEHKENGFLCDNLIEWEKSIKELISYFDKRIEMGKVARKKIITDFSVSSIKVDYLDLFL